MLRIEAWPDNGATSGREMCAYVRILLPLRALTRLGLASHVCRVEAVAHDVQPAHVILLQRSIDH